MINTTLKVVLVCVIIFNSIALTGILVLDYKILDRIDPNLKKITTSSLDFCLRAERVVIIILLICSLFMAICFCLDLLEASLFFAAFFFTAAMFELIYSIIIIASQTKSECVWLAEKASAFFDDIKYYSYIYHLKKRYALRSSTIYNVSELQTVFVNDHCNFDYGIRFTLFFFALPTFLSLLAPCIVPAVLLICF